MEVYARYDMLPKLGNVTEPLFLPHYPLLEKEKYTYKKYFEYDVRPSVLGSAAQFIVDNHPRPYLFDSFNFSSVCDCIHEDIVIHCVDKEKDWLAAMHVTFPNGWSPELAIGKSYDELHRHLPGINLKNSRKMLEACVKGQFQRYVWGVIYEEQRNGHPSIVTKSFDSQNPQFWIRVETQIIVGCAELSYFLFILRQKLIPEIEVDKKLLLSSLASMTPEQKKHKGISEDFIRYLS